MKIAIAVALSLVAVVCAFAFYLADPMYLRAPSDASIAASFRAHRDEFNQLVAMAEDDKVGLLSASRLDAVRDPVRRKRYHALLSGIGGGVILAHADDSTRFILGSGGLAAFGPGWLKGIQFLADPRSLPGSVVGDLDHMSALPVGGVYLRQLEPGWYVVVQKVE